MMDVLRRYKADEQDKIHRWFVEKERWEGLSLRI